MNSPAHPNQPLAFAQIQARILREHQEMDELLLQHQEALIEQDLTAAQQHYSAFHALLQSHIALEDSLLLPQHQQLEKPQWRSLVYSAEHEKLLQVAQLLGERLSRPLPAERSPRLRAIIKLLDDERSLKNLVEHHNEREEKGMLPELQTALA